MATHSPEDNEVVKFLRRNDACKTTFAALKAMVTKGEATTFEDLWAKCPEPGWLLWGLDRAGYAGEPEKKGYQFACELIRSIESHLADPRSRRAFQILQQYVSGHATAADLAVAQRSARQALDAYRRDDARRKFVSKQTRVAQALVAALACGEGDWIETVDYAAGLAGEAAAANPRNGKVDWDKWIEYRKRQAAMIREFVTEEQLQELISSLRKIDC
jgi:hypothetical protein